MSEDDPTLAQVVMQVIETLSDAVSQLVLFVVIREEENSPVPPELPQATNVVANAANGLVGVAKNLAEYEYSSYPDIKKDIVDSADQVAIATNELIETVNHLVSAQDRKSGWARLSDACKIIAGKTVHLLQIVYGAELARLYALGSELEDALDKLDPAQAGQDPQGFANTAGDVASKAAQLAQYLSDKAKEEESPFLKKLLEDCAEELKKQSEELIDLANQLLQDPDNPDLQRKFADKMNQIKDTTRKALDALKDVEAERTPQQLDFRTPGELPEEIKRYRDSKLARDEAERNGDLLESLNDPLDPRASTLPLEDEKVLAKISKINDKIDDIEDSLKRKDQPSVKAELKDLDQLLQDLNQIAKSLAANKDAATKKKILDALENVNKIIPQQKAKSKNYESNPSEKQAKELEDVHDQLQNVLDQLSYAVSPPAAVTDEAHRSSNLAHKTQDSALNKDPDGLNAAAHSQNRAIEGLSENANRIAKDSSPEKQKKILDSLDAVKKILPVQLSAAKTALDQPSPKTQKELEQQTKNLENALDVLSKNCVPLRATGIVDTVDKEQKLLSDLKDAASKGNVKKVDDVSKELLGLNKDLCELLRAEAGNNKISPDGRDELLEAISELENMLPTITKEAIYSAKNPQDGSALQKLEDDLKEFENQLEDVLSATGAPLEDAASNHLEALEKLAQSVRDGDSKKAGEAAKELAKAQHDLKPTAEQQAATLRDEEKRRNLLQDLDDLENLLPPLLESSQKALQKPSLENLNDFDNNVEKMRNRVLEMTEDSKPFHESIVPHERAVPKIDRPKESAVRELESRAPRVVEIAEELKNSPNNPDVRKNFNSLLDSLMGPLENLLGGLDDKQKVTAAKDQVDADFHRLEDAIERKEPTEILQSTKDVNLDLKALQDQANNALSSISDPAEKKKAQDAINEISKLIPQLNESAKALAQNPFDIGAKEDFRKARDGIKNNANILEEIINPHSPVDQVNKNVQEQLNELENLRKSANNKDPKGIDQSLDRLGKMNDELEDMLRNQAAQTTDLKKKQSLLGGIDELEDLLSDLGKSGKRLSKNPNDPDALNRLNNQLDDFAKTLRSIPPQISHPGASEAKKALHQLDELVEATRRGDPKDVTEKAKELAATSKKLNEAAKTQAAKEANPEKKREITENADDVLKKLAGVIEASKKSLTDKSKPTDLSKPARELRVPLKDLIAKFEPTKQNEIEAVRERLKRATDRVTNDAHQAKPVHPGLEEFQKVFNRIQKKAKDLQGDTPKDQRIDFDETLKKMDELKPKFEKQAQSAQANPSNEREQKKLDELSQQLQDLTDRLSELSVQGAGTDADKLTRAKAKAQALISALKGGKMDPKTLINAARLLASQLGNLINLAKLEAAQNNGQPLSEKAKLALELDRMLSAIEAAANDRASGRTNTDVNKLLNDLQELSSKSGSAKPVVKHKASPNTFEGAITQVVESVHKVLDHTRSKAPQLKQDATIVGTTNIAHELEKLAEAARNGDKQSLLVCGRSISACIVAMSAELKDVSSRCKDKRLQDKLVRTNQALRNYSTQLKILAAVKAAGGTKDTDEQLITLTRSLGSALQDAVTTVSIIKSTKRV